jgi:hypothetical protein
LLAAEVVVAEAAAELGTEEGGTAFTVPGCGSVRLQKFLFPFEFGAFSGEVVPISESKQQISFFSLSSLRCFFSPVLVNIRLRALVIPIEPEGCGCPFLSSSFWRRASPQTFQKQQQQQQRYISLSLTNSNERNEGEDGKKREKSQRITKVDVSQHDMRGRSTTERSRTK